MMQRSAGRANAGSLSPWKLTKVRLGSVWGGCLPFAETCSSDKVAPTPVFRDPRLGTGKFDPEAAVRGARYRSARYPGRTFVPAWSPSPLTEPFAPSDRLARLSSELNGEQNVLVHVTSHRASSDRSPTLSLNKHGDTSGIGACF